MKEENMTKQTPETDLIEKEKEKARDPFAALFEIMDILAGEYEKEQEEKTDHE